MNQNISRRSLAKGAVWSVPTIAAATAVPAYAASACSMESKTAIDNEFDTLPQTVPLELNLYQTLAASNGYVQSVYVNLKNTGSEPITFTELNPLRVQIQLQQDKRFDTPRGISTATSWGDIADNGYDPNLGVHTYTWTFVGTIPSTGDTEADSVFHLNQTGTGSDRVFNTVDITLLEDIPPATPISEILSDPAQQSSCLDYYQKAYYTYAETVQTLYSYRGPLASGELAANQEISSADFGNYSSGVLAVNRDGTF